jgi:hypothetical protein
MPTPKQSQQPTVPATIRTYLDAQAVGQSDVAVRTFAAGAVVTDQGETFTGVDDIGAFLNRASTEFTYTTEETGAEKIDDQHWVVDVRLEGDFPGGVADLRYRFTVVDEQIAELFIGA